MDKWGLVETKALGYMAVAAALLDVTAHLKKHNEPVGIHGAITTFIMFIIGVACAIWGLVQFKDFAYRIYFQLSGSLSKEVRTRCIPATIKNLQELHDAYVSEFPKHAPTIE